MGNQQGMAGWSEKSNSVKNTTTSAVISVSAMAGLFYAITTRKSLWATAGIVLLCSVAGGGIGYIIQKNSA
jgi:uncharacterized membrane protein YfcA